MKLSREYTIIFIIMVTEIMGFSLILPFLPFYAQEYGASPLVVGTILTVFSIFQFISAPIMGRISDSYGRKPLLIFSQLSTFISFVVLGFANSLWMIFASRIIDGMLGSNFTIAQAYISDVSSEKDRSKAFGLTGAAFGVGFLIGPAIGGFLSQYSYSLPAFLAAGLSFISILITHFFLKETITEKKPVKISWRLFHFREFTGYFKDKSISPKLFEFFAYILAHTLYTSTLALYAERQLGFSATDVGYFLAYVGLNSIILRGVLLSRLIDRFGERKLQIAGAVSMIIGFIAMAFIHEWWQFLIFATFFSFGTGVSRPVIIGEVSRRVSPKEQGAVLGVTSSLTSIAQIFGPLMGGFLINFFFPGSMPLVAAMVMGVGLYIVLITNTASKHIVENMNKIKEKINTP